jgi:aminoglycoside phosphotransferase (APT) family kinase protein
MAIDRQAAFSGTFAAPLDFDTGTLEEWLRGALPGFAGPMALARFKGGQSNPTFRLSTPGHDYVLRKKPPGKLLPSAHAIEREYRIISHLRARGFPVARPHVLCTDEDVVGTAFYVMDFVAGRIAWEPHKTPSFDAMNRTIAALHALPLDGIEDFGRPEGYVARQVKRWSEQYRASETGTVAAMDRLMAWLPDAVPKTNGAAIVHGDFRADNCIFHATEPRILAVLDWELATLGDPVADFTYHLMQWHMPVSDHGIASLKGHEKDAGIPAIEDYIADYCERAGRQGIPDLDVYLAYNFFRLAAILQGIAGRVRDGTAANANAPEMIRQIPRLAETAWAFAKAAGA